jgi:hypothetical protein
MRTEVAEVVVLGQGTTRDEDKYLGMYHNKKSSFPLFLFPLILQLSLLMHLCVCVFVCVCVYVCVCVCPEMFPQYIFFQISHGVTR